LVKQTGLDAQEAYGTFNMGAGFAVFIPQKDVEKTLDISKQQNIKVYDVGRVEKGAKQVILEPIGVTYASESLQVRE
jgi:phosphoribosylformylglycinamidine cyclo-ligase